MTIEDYKPRFAFEISPEQKARADRVIDTHGLRRALFSPILDDVLDLLEKHGQVVAGLIIDKHVRASDIIPIISKARKVAERI